MLNRDIVIKSHHFENTFGKINLSQIDQMNHLTKQNISTQNDASHIHDEFSLLHVQTRESAVLRQRMISYLQFYMSVQIAMGGIFGIILVNLPNELNDLSIWTLAYICGAGLLMSIGSFAYGALGYIPKNRKEGWITKGMSQVGNTHDIEAWNLIFTDHLRSIESANHVLRRHINRIRILVLLEVILLVTGFFGAFIFWG
jgi:hypothetical protein